MKNHRKRIAVTGGPGGGKTTALDLFRREIGESVVIVPESATMLFSGGFPRTGVADAKRAAQTAIFHVQKNLEEIQSVQYPDRVLLCDRGTVDGAAFWPEGSLHFFEAMNTTLEEELLRYGAVIFFESAAVGGISIEGGNPVRKESMAEAVLLDTALRTLWEQHPHFHLVHHQTSFLEKITNGIHLLKHCMTQLHISSHC